MDRATQRLRRAHWLEIIRACQSRPEGQTAESWLRDNGINRKTYYYWLYKIRRDAAAEIQRRSLPQNCDSPAQVTFAEIPAPSLTTMPAASTQDVISGFQPDAMIYVGDTAVAVTSSASAELIRRIVEVLTYAR